jgi:RNA polymerase sigma-70 factor (ECF subfamily)
MDQPLGDRELLQRIQDADESALQELLSRYWESVLRVASQLLDSWDAAEDVAQETFIRLWERREEWGLDGSVRGLLFRIARNAAIDARRKRSADERAAARVPERSASERPDEITEQRELEAAVNDALASLPERRREVFILVRQHGLSYKEVAQALDLSAQTVANHMSLALADIRDQLEPLLFPQQS